MRYGIEYNEENDQQKENGGATQRYVGEHTEIDELRAADPFYFGEPNDAHYAPDELDDGEQRAHVKKLDHMTTR